jgi:hypothetical protein
MKPSDKPQISKKWWTSEKPGDIKGAELEKALVSAEKALDEEKKKKGDGPALEAGLAACKELESAVDKTIKKECDKKTHKDVIKVLEKYFPLIKDETSRLKKLLEESAKEGGEEQDDEESDGKIFEKDYLYKMLKLLKSTGKELNFGFGLDTKNPEGSTLLLTRKGKPERLFKALKQTGDFTNRLITYGKAMPDPENGKVLVFTLAESAGEPPQVLKLGRRFLRSDKGLKFRKLRLILPGGQVFNDTEPDDEEAVAGAGPSPATPAGGKRLSQQEKDDIRKRVAEMERRLDELMAENRVAV